MKERHVYWLAIVILVILAILSNFTYSFQDHFNSTLEASELALYAMDYKYKDNHKQFYIVATDGGLAQEAARESGYEITSMRKIKIPILVVR